MSIEAYQAVWQNSKQTGGLKLTLMALAEFASPENNYHCWPSIATLAGMVRVTDRQIQTNIQQLEKSGEIMVNRNTGRGNANEYDLTPLVKGEVRGKKGEAESIKGEPDFTNNDEERVKSDVERVKSSVIKGEPDFTPTVREPLRTKELESPPATNPRLNLPVHLATEAMMAKWSEWLEYQRESTGRELPVATAKRQFRDFDAWGADKAIAAMEFTMSKGYKGLVEPPTGWHVPGTNGKQGKGHTFTPGEIMESMGEQFRVINVQGDYERVTNQ